MLIMKVQATAIQNVTDAKNNADNQISQATSNHDVDVAKNGGITNISSIRPVYTKSNKHVLKLMINLTQKKPKSITHLMQHKKRKRSHH